ncbi:hypothetical protein AKO1_002409 [Acrasis kona]|uniref:Uncharacterized protein n=1 Tax=Acrasis kona TaxID=1008807 RepID=A0AAW2ZRK3_9EUKA
MSDSSFASSTSQEHVYPSSMANLPIYKSLTKKQDLMEKRKQYQEWEKKIQELKRIKTKRNNKKITLDAINRTLQKATNLEQFVKDKQLGQLYNILKQDYDSIKEVHDTLEEQYEKVSKESENVKSRADEHEKAMNELHELLEKAYTQIHSIDDLVTRYGLPSTERFIQVNIGCTHHEYLHGLLHVFENWICFESIIDLDRFDEQYDESEVNKRVIKIPIKNITSMSKKVEMGGDDAIVINTVSGEKFVFFNIRNRDKVFFDLFQHSFHQKALSN